MVDSMAASMADSKVNSRVALMVTKKAASMADSKVARMAASMASY